MTPKEIRERLTDVCGCDPEGMSRCLPCEVKAYVIKLEDMLKESRNEMKFASIFIRSRQKMHPTGVELYDEYYARLEQLIKDTDHGE